MGVGVRIVSFRLEHRELADLAMTQPSIGMRGTLVGTVICYSFEHKLRANSTASRYT
jgi:hypothetical protein